MIVRKCAGTGVATQENQVRLCPSLRLRSSYYCDLIPIMEKERESERVREQEGGFVDQQGDLHHDTQKPTPMLHYI